MMVEYNVIGASPRLDNPHLFCRRSVKSFCLLFVLLCVLLLPLAWTLPCSRDEHWISYAGGVQEEPLGIDDACGSYGDGVSSVYVRRDSPGCAGLKRACAHLDSFCFPSVLPGLLDEEGKCQAPSLETSEDSSGMGDIDLRWLSNHAVYRLSNGKKVSCSTMDVYSGISDRLPPRSDSIDQNGAAVCKEPLLPHDAWMQKSSGIAVAPAENSVKIESSLIDTSLSPFVEIDPPLLDWGVKHLYSPSLAFLTVANTHNDSILYVYEPFSTDPQFYLHGFEELSIAPGEAASIAFAFLPRWLGSLSAHLVLQTSFGGFIIQAKGKAVESSYRIQPLVGFDVSRNGRLHKNLSLYNPSNDILHIEEVMTWVSFVSGNMSHSSCVICRPDAHQQSSQELSSFVHDNGGVKRGEYAQVLVGVRPHMKWEILPHDAEKILEVILLPNMKGNVSGVVHMKLQNSSSGRVETVMVPLEAEMHHKVGYHALTGSISVFLYPFMPCNDRGSMFLLSLRNGASQVSQVLKISEVTDTEELFNIRYMEGLILYPGTLTQIALIMYTSPTDSEVMSFEVPSESQTCIIKIVTNESVNPHIGIPCQDIIHACSGQDPVTRSAGHEDSYVGLSFDYEDSTYVRTVSSGSISKKKSLMKSNSLEILEADEIILRNWKSQGTMINMSLLEDHELLFPTVEVGNQFSKWITVKNPSQKPVLMQLLLSSGAVIDQCKAADDPSEHHVMTRFSHINSMETSHGFSVGKSAIIEALVHPSETATFGPIVFHPSDRCMWKSSVLIRNNLSGVEWLPLLGLGGSHSLVLLEESKPVQKLEFNLDWPTPNNVSSLEPQLHMESRSACGTPMSKELFVKNTGELSLKVLKVEVSGTSCRLDGFSIDSCKGFVLAPGESMRLHISYQTELSAPVIERDLELALASGHIVIPMKASTPIYVIKFCRKSIVWSFLRVLPLIAFVAFTLIAMLFWISPHVSSSGSEDYLIKNTNTIATIRKVEKSSRVHHNPRNARSDREGSMPEVGVVGRYSECPSSVQESTRSVVTKQDFDYQEKVPLLPPSEAKSVEEAERSAKSKTRSGTPESPKTANLTVKIVREKGKRRKRRASGTVAGLATQLEVSSSQSGNSTPSSPLSPNMTPKQSWPLSPEASENSHTGLAPEKNQEKNRVVGCSLDATHDLAPIKCYRNTWRSPAYEWPSVPGIPVARPVLSPSATFPGPGWRAPGVATTFLASTSPIAPHARAPGSRLGKEKMVKRDEGAMQEKAFTYDIWGNHLSDHIMGRSKELSTRPFSDVSEGDSPSFFARGPQSLMKMSSARSVSPGTTLPPCDVNYNHQMV